MPTTNRFTLGPSNFISQLLLLWVFKLFSANHQNLKLKNKKATLLKKNYKNDLYAALKNSFGKEYCLLSFYKLAWAVLTSFSSFILLKLFIIQKSHLIAGLIFLACFLAQISWHQLMLSSTLIGVKARANLISLIYIKSLKLATISNIGDVVNLISNDSNRIAEAFVHWHFLWSAILECCLICSLAIYNIGVSSLPGVFVVLLILLPLQYLFAYYASKINFERTNLITKRVSLMSEIITTIKLIKFYAWERFYLEKISQKREVEIKMMKKGLGLKIAILVLVFLAPSITTFICLATYFYSSTGDFDAATVFSLLSLFNTLRYPLLMLPIAVRSTTAARSSLKRLEEFYNLPEIDTPKLPLRTPEDEPTLCMRINGACFSWDGDLEHPHITDLSLDLHRGKIYGVVGDVGSGKSLLAGIMGQLKLKKGSVDIYYKKMDPSQPLKTSNISSPIGDISSSDVEMDNLNEPNQYNDSVEDLGEIIEEEVVEKFKFGYVPQEPWEIDASIRDNIIFGEEWDEQKYSEVVRTCGLLRDIMLLSNGDLTNVTELNLSNNSQRQRLSLARCLYHEPDMVLLEDCLGDFDSSSAKTLFSELVKGYMLKRNKCVIYFTNQKQFLTHCDLILVLKAGTVIEKGTYLELKNKHVNFSTYVSDYSPIEDDPTGLLDTVNELRFLSGGGNKQLISKKNNSLLRSIRSPSPLATAKVITNAEVSEVASADDQTENDYHQLNQSTIKSLKSQNPYSVQMNSLSEQAISKIIEKNQLSILTGNPNQSQRKPPTNFTNQDIVSSMIQQNSLTVLSEFDMDIGFGMENSGGESLEDGTTDRKDRYYDLYLKEKTGRSLGLLVIFSFFLVSGLRFASDYWLGLIVSHFQATKNRALTFDFAIYGGFSALILFGVLFRGFAFSASIVLKSVSLHDRVIKAILRAPISFYDVTPIGQILSNFYRHLYLIDDTLPEGWLQVLSFSPVLFGTVILVSLVVPWFWLTLPIYFFFGILLVFKCSQLEQKLKVLEASNKSPMFSHLSSTLEGLFSIRLYQTEKRFTAFNQTLIDADHKVLYSLMAVRSLQALYIDFIACIFIYITCLFCLLFNVEDVYTGLSVSNSLQLLLFVQWLIRVSGEVNSTMSSVSSVVYFGKHCPAEAPSVIPENRPPKSWPQSGKIEFKNVVLKYNRFGVAVLKSVSFKINSGEKIGIVGRSGSGKTTILVSLMRMTELAEGQIYVDGIDISSIGLKDLRSRIAVIPQEPVLLTGTIRSNLDPFGKCSDEQVWKSLHGVHLATKIKEMPAKLDTSVIENGKAFTIAERQLFCIARAILLETKILVFDEPLVSVDTETDKLIQQTISENFSDHTVIVLASRFNLIMESDKIMVMDGGKIVEFDTPLTLLDAPRSRFLKMIAQTGGDADLIKLRKIAVKQNEKRKLNLKLSKSPSLHVPPPISKTNSQTSSISDTSNESKMPKSLEGIFLKEDSNNKSESISTSLSNIAAVDSLSSLDNQATSTTNLLNNH